MFVKYQVSKARWVGRYSRLHIEKMVVSKGSEKGLKELLHSRHKETQCVLFFM